MVRDKVDLEEGCCLLPLKNGTQMLPLRTDFQKREPKIIIKKNTKSRKVVAAQQLFGFHFRNLYTELVSLFLKVIAPVSASIASMIARDSR